MKFVTVANKKDGYFNILEKQIEDSGYKLNVLGQGEKWGGFMWRYLLISKFLENLLDDEIVVIIDGYDVLYVNNVGLEDKFKSLDANILFGVDIINSFFNKMLYKRAFPYVCVYDNKEININAGMYMGYCKYLKLFISLICSDNDCSDKNIDDQRMLSLYCNNTFFNENVKFDMDSKIFLNLYRDNILSTKSSFKLTEGQVIINNNTPNFVHGPGNIDLNFILNPEQSAIQSVRKNYYSNLCVLYLKYFIPDLIIIMIVVIICIVIIKIK